ncbi:MAG: LysR family transcriptional regulator [Halofilum sp. (in: g-proteobacteria)]|nr:LysR family transcriptional regulator [Halofilum sp. (in: g-proteobacteria)]
MEETARHMPSLKALTAFETTVRLGSMTAAARELGSTQPAVSQRIRTLEDQLGVPLFDRTTRRMRLTRDGEAFHEEIAGQLQRIHGASHRLQSRAHARHRELMIATNFGFAHRWLLTRLPRLEAAFPGTHFEIVPVDRDDAPEMMNADLSIRFGPFTALRENEWSLFPESVYPVCSPACRERLGLDAVLDNAGLQRAPLLHMDDREPRWMNWHEWSGRAGLEAPVRATRFNYNNYPLLLNAAAEGKGLALGWAGLVDSMIEEGTLVALGPTVGRDDRGYLVAARHPASAIIAPIVDWFRRQTGHG